MRDKPAVDGGMSGGWITEPGWRFTDTWFAHVCERNAAPVMAISYRDGVYCPKCEAHLSISEQLEMMGGLGSIWKGRESEMCPHNDFKIIYYKDGIMLRRCKDCQQIEIHLEWIWADVDDVKAALDSFRGNSENP